MRLTVKHLPHPLGSLVLYRGVRFYIYNVHTYTGTYDLVYETGGSRQHNVSHSEVTMLFPPATVCDWNRMLEANLK